MNYLIHTCTKRLWYVERYLVPSMKEQGITDNEIKLYVDTDGDGLLTSYLKSYKYTEDKDTWHLQDDIIISSHFKEQAEKQRTQTVICGFCNGFSTGKPGRVNLYNMWYSMPCIKIPGILFKEFIQWMNKPEVRKRLVTYFEGNKYIDVFFETFLKETYPKLLVWNIAPNMVNHIDHLLGGSLANKTRSKGTDYIMATYWDEPELLTNIENLLREDQND